MLRTRRSITEMFPYDVWLEIFNYFSFAANLGINDVFSSHLRMWQRSDHEVPLVRLVIKTNFQTKCILRFVSKEFKFLTSSIFYEVLVFKKWDHVADLLALLDRDAHVREILSRSTRRIDFPPRTESNDEFETAAVLLNACPNVTHLICSFGTSAGTEFLEHMGTMGFGPKLQYLHLADCHVDMIIPYLQCFTNLEVLLLSDIDTKQSTVSTISAKVNMPKLKVFGAPYHPDLQYMQDHVLEAPLLSRNGRYLDGIRDDRLWKEYGPQFRRLTINHHTFSTSNLKHCANLQSLVLPLDKFRDFDGRRYGYYSILIPRLESLVVTTDRSWERGYKQEKMDAVFRNLLKSIERGAFPSLKTFRIDAPKFRKRAWETFPWASRVWHRHFSSRGIQLEDSEGALEPPPSDF